MTPLQHANYLRSLERLILLPWLGFLTLSLAALVAVPMVVGR